MTCECLCCKIRPVIWLGRLLGFSCVRLKCPDGFKICYLSIILSLAMAFVLVVAFMCNILDISSAQARAMVVFYIIDTINLISSATFVVIGVFQSNRKVDVCRMLSQINKDHEKYGLEEIFGYRDLKSIRRRAFFHAFLILLIMLMQAGYVLQYLCGLDADLPRAYFIVFFVRGMISALSDVVVIVFCLQFSLVSRFFRSMIEQLYKKLYTSMNSLAERRPCEISDFIGERYEIDLSKERGDNHFASSDQRDLPKQDFIEMSRNMHDLGKSFSAELIEHERIGENQSVDHTKQHTLYLDNLQELHGHQRSLLDENFACPIRELFRHERDPAINYLNQRLSNQELYRPTRLSISEPRKPLKTFASFLGFIRKSPNDGSIEEKRKRTITQVQNSSTIAPGSRINKTEEQPEPLVLIFCQLSRFYGRILRSLALMNRALDPLLLLQMAVLIVCLVLNAYLVVQFLITSEENAMFLLSLTRLVVHAISVLYLLTSSENLYRTIFKVLGYIIRYPMTKLSMVELTQIELLYKRIYFNPPMFTASGVFNLSISILGSISSAIITYVLVALQFRAVWNEPPNLNSTNIL